VILLIVKNQNTGKYCQLIDEEKKGIYEKFWSINSREERKMYVKTLVTKEKSLIRYEKYYTNNRYKRSLFLRLKSAVQFLTAKVVGLLRFF